VRTKRELKRPDGSYIKFDTNSAVMVSKEASRSGPASSSGGPRAPREEVHEDHLAGAGGPLDGPGTNSHQERRRVYVLSGKEKGKTGKVNGGRPRAAARRGGESLMVFKRHYKRGRNPSAPRAGSWRRTGASTSRIWRCGPGVEEPTRIGTKLLENGKRVRVAKRSGAQIDQA